MTTPPGAAPWAVILAGGGGTRLWPRSRRHLPKPCLTVGGRSLLQHTVERLRPLIPPERVVVVTGEEMADPVRRQLPQLPPDQVLVEPAGRSTAPAAAWGTWVAARRGAERVAVLPSDHGVADAPAFRSALRAALDATDRFAAVLLGMTPTGPETGFGWIEVEGGTPPLPVRRFVEKPDRATAAALLGRSALWNAGMFCWRPDALRQALAAHLPGLAGALAALDDGAAIEEVWEACEPISVDHGVLEPVAAGGALRLGVLPAAFGWSDLGTHTALDAWQGEAEVAASLALQGGAHALHAPGKLVVTVGLQDLVIVDTDDALLICRKGDAQRVGEVVEALRRAGLQRFT